MNLHFARFTVSRIGKLPKELTRGPNYLSFVRNADYLQADALRQHLEAGFKSNGVGIVQAHAGHINDFPKGHVEMVAANLCAISKRESELKSVMTDCREALLEAPEERYHYTPSYHPRSIHVKACAYSSSSKEEEVLLSKVSTALQKLCLELEKS